MGSGARLALLDADPLPGEDGVFCALHRADSFISAQPGTSGTRVAAYRWNVFEFSGIRDEPITSRCMKQMAIVE